MNVSLLIVVPTLNSHALLPRLLRSLQEQSFSHWRLLFIDGPSGPEHRQWLVRCCSADSRCRWLEQDPAEPGIFGAMNQGFAHASLDDWLLFWGSDDWAAAPDVLAKAIAPLESATRWPDLLVCRARYAEATSSSLSRPTVFHSAALLSTSAYVRALLLGSTPPHQGTLIGPGARRRLARYCLDFSLSADLDYFLQLSRFSDICIQCLDIELVHMADAGVSGQQPQRRIQEVAQAYHRRFGLTWWFPFLLRYILRLASLIIHF